ncbi:hypothetical protein GCM10027073_17740 [Streptomyces chlorus]|uniref:Uncharacterized protein n=1 Tax=Streptomyces chlorus TaxID=887452 RepID=A0ABW1E0C7_9ACTN
MRYRRALILLASAGGNRVPVIARLVQADEGLGRDFHVRLTTAASGNRLRFEVSGTRGRLGGRAKRTRRPAPPPPTTRPTSFGIVFDKKFEESMMDHVSTIDTLRKRYFDAAREFKFNPDRSAHRAAWRMIRSEEGLDDF